MACGLFKVNVLHLPPSFPIYFDLFTIGFDLRPTTSGIFYMLLVCLGVRVGHLGARTQLPIEEGVLVITQKAQYSSSNFKAE